MYNNELSCLEVAAFRGLGNLELLLVLSSLHVWQLLTACYLVPLPDNLDRTDCLISLRTSSPTHQRWCICKSWAGFPDLP